MCIYIFTYLCENCLSRWLYRWRRNDYPDITAFLLCCIMLTDYNGPSFNLSTAFLNKRIHLVLYLRWKKVWMYRLDCVGVDYLNREIRCTLHFFVVNCSFFVCLFSFQWDFSLWVWSPLLMSDSVLKSMKFLFYLQIHSQSHAEPRDILFIWHVFNMCRSINSNTASDLNQNMKQIQCFLVLSSVVVAWAFISYDYYYY